MAKNTYGTGCFMLMHTGSAFQTSTNGLITTSAAQASIHPEFALEGSVFVGGAVVQWLRDGLGAIRSSAEVQALAESVPDSGGVMLVPAFTGLGAPYWNPQARGTMTGLTRGTTTAHIARAALESIAFQSAALLLAMSRDAQQAGAAPVTELRVDGGACVNDLLMQFQADLLGIAVVRPMVTETTALGAAYLAGLSSGLYPSTEVLSQLWKSERRFEPRISPSQAQPESLKFVSDLTIVRVVKYFYTLPRAPPAGVNDDCVDSAAWMAQLAVERMPPQKPRSPQMKSWKDRLKTGAMGSVSHMAA
jgi:glycerol kinase